MTDTADLILVELAAILSPLAEVVQPDEQIKAYDYEQEQLIDSVGESIDRLVDLLEDAGIDPDNQIEDASTELAKLLAALTPTWQALKDFLPPAKPTLDLSKIQAATTAVKELIAAVKSFTSKAKATSAPAPKELTQRLIEHLIARHFRENRPALFWASALTGVIDDEAYEQAQVGQFAFSKIGTVLTDATAAIDQVHGFSAGTFEQSQFLDRLSGLLDALGINNLTLVALAHNLGGESQATPSKEPLPALTVPLFNSSDPAITTTLLLGLFGLPERGALKPGLVATLLGSAQGKQSLPLDDFPDWTLSLEAEAKSEAEVGIVVRPGRIVVESAEARPLPTINTLLRAESPKKELSLVAAGPLVVDGTGPAISLTIALDEAQPGFRIEVALQTGRLALSPTEGDGFLQSIMPDGAEVKLSPTFGYKTGQGFYFERGGGLGAEVPVNVDIGSLLKVSSVGLLGQPMAERLGLAATLNGGANLGPLAATVEGIGANIVLGFAPDDATPIKLEVDFVPPTGLGLAIDAGVVTGGGFIAYDAEKGRYVGGLSLTLEALGLTAFGMLDTRLPKGADGYSLLVFIAGTFAPIPLGFGFTLNGIGGILGIHRDVNRDALFKAVRSGSSGKLLSLEDPIREAPSIARRASRLFPVAKGQHVFGPTVKLGWGSPKELVSLDLALLLTLPDPLRLIVIGDVSAALPDPKVPVIQLNVALAGVLDISASRLEAEGKLYDSVVQLIPISGGFALRTAWGRASALAFSVGGFHPAFERPAGFPSLDRMGVDLSKGRSFQLRLAGYFAITANSLQLGARADFRAGIKGFSITGELGFDALIVFNPFGLDLAIYAGVRVKRGRKSICSIRVSGRLRGPGPWIINGRASIEILFFDVEVRFEKRFGSAQRQALAGVNVAGLLGDALSEVSAWRTAPAGSSPVVLDRMEGRLDPLGQLSVRQKTVPMGILLEQFGGRELIGPRRFDLIQVKFGNVTGRLAKSLREPFAPGQFLKLSEKERLGSPGFESFLSGAAFEIGDGIDVGEAVETPLGVETLIIDADDSVSLAARRSRVSIFRPSAHSHQRTTPQRTVQPKNASPSGAIQVTDEKWQTVDDQLQPLSVATTRTELRQQRPDLPIARQSEVKR